MDKHIEKIIIEYLVGKINPRLIMIFGSFAKGNFNDYSDIDIGYLSSEKLDKYEEFLIKEELANILSRDIDLININTASTVFKMQIFSSGKKIYTDNTNFVDEFIIRAYKDYCLLNEERQIILDKIKEKGEIYGK
ncbi:type VII toxin-antitoxin system MntA family adenylyltransferase antitoxin [Helicovermis profundi]|uniref:Polymerase beta nucleotidyltransferase domain-containing protein n=1 Tax=Helicovermis profundi TaxID=3065157 RepID=A0AAU9EMY0_9FIRM|nr:hypothetical protein HLPR_01360 [Clostridia bacterium S502]